MELAFTKVVQFYHATFVGFTRNFKNAYYACPNGNLTLVVDSDLFFFFDDFLVPKIELKKEMY